MLFPTYYLLSEMQFYTSREIGAVIPITRDTELSADNSSDLETIRVRLR